MSTFNMQGQHVGKQINVGGDYYESAGDINFAAVKNRADFATELDKLKQELVAAREQNFIDEDTETVAKGHLIQAAKEAKAPEPNKNALLGYLSSAKDVLKGVTEVSSIVGLLTKAAEWVQGML